MTLACFLERPSKFRPLLSNLTYFRMTMQSALTLARSLKRNAQIRCQLTGRFHMMKKKLGSQAVNSMLQMVMAFD